MYLCHKISNFFIQYYSAASAYKISRVYHGMMYTLCIICVAWYTHLLHNLMKLSRISVSVHDVNTSSCCCFLQLLAASWQLLLLPGSSCCSCCSCCSWQTPYCFLLLLADSHDSQQLYTITSYLLKTTHLIISRYIHLLHSTISDQGSLLLICGDSFWYAESPRIHGDSLKPRGDSANLLGARFARATLQDL